MTPFVLDTDTLTLYQSGHAIVTNHVLGHAASDLAITVITAEEQLSGWYSLLRKAKTPDQISAAYDRLARSVSFLAQWTIVSFFVAAYHRFEHLKRLKLGVRAKDLRIAAIMLEGGGTLVTRNLVDFQRIPGLRIEDWSI